MVESWGENVYQLLFKALYVINSRPPRIPTIFWDISSSGKSGIGGKLISQHIYLGFMSTRQVSAVPTGIPSASRTLASGSPIPGASPVLYSHR